MKNQNILCCIDENPIFSYSPIINKDSKTLEQIIINYVTSGYVGKRLWRKEAETISNVEFIYYEINLEHAIKKIKQGKRYANSLEKFCLSFLNYFLEDTPDKLIAFLKKVKAFDNTELEEIKSEFKAFRKKSNSKSKK